MIMWVVNKLKCVYVSLLAGGHDTAVVSLDAIYLSMVKLLTYLTSG